MSSLRKGHANLLCIVPILVYVLPKRALTLLFNMLSRLVIAFLTRSKHLLISWLQSPSAVILEPKPIKSFTVSIVSHLFAKSDGTGSHALSFLNVEFQTNFFALLFHFHQEAL